MWIRRTAFATFLLLPSFTLAVAVAATALVFAGESVWAVGVYPHIFVAQARATGGVTTIASTVTIRIDRLVEPSRRTRVLDGLKYNGYQGFMNALRPLPVIGSIAAQNREVQVRYAWETKVEDRTRLIVVADTALFFLPGDSGKARAGYELTFVELLLDSRGAGSGTMAGAARVKPAPDGIVLEDFATVPVQLTLAAPSK